ncbi:Uncharacterized protein PCOAH_00009580 [Plasmodium coatneyi]|uniref:Uncharacterized protein n=1 Tax=Plasmodium coatneyi TaxID=208452 RepID=A0A1B1DVG2_9APIC|nr:Uncharacterized protein PCOAH_00009580 [Plasmodium coatneyi]ANQ06629.1 Uncharacterized protein PCOAH_00009580 [Plasmodium coatneyi]
MPHGYPYAMQLGCRGASVGARQALRTQRKKQQAGAINEYREKLQALSKHEKVVRIDLNGKEKKTCKYFFEKDKYVYVKSKEQIERFERGAGRPIGWASVSPGMSATSTTLVTSTTSTTSTTSGAIPVISSANNANATMTGTTVKERKWRKSEKALRDTYDLSQEELLYMKFVQKIKMKNIYSLLNNIRKNKYMNKKQRDTILSCIYKYISHNCYLMSKKDFFFFLYIFPQQLKYASRAVHYLKNLLDKDQVTLTECLRLICETNLYHVNCLVRGHYVRFLIRHADKINLPQILNLLSEGSYLFAITPDFKATEELLDHVLKKKLLQVVKEIKRVPLDGDLKWDYLHYMEWCARRENVYLHVLFNDLSVQLHRRIFIENVDTLKRNQDYEYVGKVLTLGRYNPCINHLNNIFLSRDEDSFHTRGKTTKVKVFPSYITQQGMNRTNGNGISAQIREEAACDTQQKNQPSNNTFLPCDDPAKTNQLSPKPTQESNTLRKMKLAFSFSTPFEKLKSERYDQLKQTYQISTKITDKNVKVLLRFFRMLHQHNSSSHLENIFCRDNLPQIVSDLRREGGNPPVGSGRIGKTHYGENSPLWRLTRWWNDQVISSPSKQVPSFYNLFEHTQGKPLLPCKIPQSEEMTLLPDQQTKRVKKTHRQEESPSNGYHLSKSIPDENLPPIVQAEDTISRIVHNVYFNTQCKKKYFQKSQLNCLAKSLLYMSNSFVQYAERGDCYEEEVNPHRKKNNLLLTQVEKTFYEIFTYVMKNVYLINLSNWFHIFVAIGKFGGAAKGGELPLKMLKRREENAFPTDRMRNLLQIVHTVRAYRYEEVHTIVEEEDSRRCLQIGESPFRGDNLPCGDPPNYGALHRIILSKFSLNDDPANYADKQPPLVSQRTHNLGKTTKTPPPTVKYTYQMDRTPCMITLQRGAYFLLTMLSNYLDGAPFQTKRFLIILYHLNRSILKEVAIQVHLETRLHRNHEKFRNRYFYMHTGCGGKKPILEKSLVAKVRASYLALKRGHSPGLTGWRGCPIHPNGDNHTHDVYAQMENLLRKKKHLFTLDDMITFIVTYSLNGLYHSTIYLPISKWLFQHNLASLPDEVKIFLFLLFGQCRHVHKPLYLYLLRLVSQMEKVNEESGLPLLCALIHMVIKHDNHTKKVKLRHVRYVERKFGKIHWPYFFPVELFLWKSAHKIATRRIHTMEESDRSNGQLRNDTRKTTTTCERINSRELTLNVEFNLSKFQDYLKERFPQIIQQLEKRSVGGEGRRIISTVHGGMSPQPPDGIHLLDENTHQEVLQNCKNLLSYHFVQRNFLLSRRSLYYNILVHLKRWEKG